MSNILKTTHIGEATALAAKEIQENKGYAEKGIQRTLKCRFPKLNKILLGGWSFNSNYVICGGSGSGTSYMTNLLYQDFCDPITNKNYPHDIVILHFNFEMSSADETIRSVSTLTAHEYRKILSIDKAITAEEHTAINASLDKLKDKPIFYVEEVGNVEQIYNTIMEFASKYPNKKLVVGLDHTLLTNYQGEASEVALVSKLCRMFIDVRKRLQNMNILISQLNTEIEKPERIGNPSLHYPLKRDIHGSKFIYQTADFLMVMHAPELLGITAYGKKRWGTDKLIALHFLKGRKVEAGMVIRLKNELHRGVISQWYDEEGTKSQINFNFR